MRTVLGLAFNPAIGATFTPSTGVLDFTLGENGPNIPASEVAVDVSTKTERA